ncbi:hypothetical protein NIES4071_07570 [Calothrix sp. NIES-4071]|nr:hypothetical protein NIES4071_07570 [Calothrix sp. NIES-4071]BAZ55099.1 hypothetical protein NIES4105_07530 [Calothrix sp. NIES-4105]
MLQLTKINNMEHYWFVSLILVVYLFTTETQSPQRREKEKLKLAPTLQNL